jgi:hypothetical protein
MEEVQHNKRVNIIGQVLLLIFFLKESPLVDLSVFSRLLFWLQTVFLLELSEQWMVL